MGSKAFDVDMNNFDWERKTMVKHFRRHILDNYRHWTGDLYLYKNQQKIKYNIFIQCFLREKRDFNFDYIKTIDEKKNGKLTFIPDLDMPLKG